MPKQLLPTLPDGRYQTGIWRVLKGLSLPPGPRFKTAREKVNAFAQSIVADVVKSHGAVNTRHLALIEKAKRSLRVLLLVDSAIRQDGRYLTGCGDLDMASDDLLKLLDHERKAASDLAQALERLAVPIERGDGKSPWDQWWEQQQRAPQDGAQCALDAEDDDSYGSEPVEVEGLQEK